MKKSTQANLNRAYLRILNNNEKLTVRNLCAIANVGKSTFYNSYKNIDEFEKQANIILILNECERILNADESTINAELHTLISGEKKSDLPITRMPHIYPLLKEILKNILEKYEEEGLLYVTIISGILNLKAIQNPSEPLIHISDFDENFYINLVKVVKEFYSLVYDNITKNPDLVYYE